MHDTLDLQKVGVKPPPIPSKHDIVPIHTSDRGSFKYCRRYWHWASPMRENLRAKVTQAGVIMPLWFGTGIHYALEQYYDPFLRRDPIETFKTWYVLQMDGGIVGEYDLRLTLDPHPVEVHQIKKAGERALTNTYRVQGLNELHPDPDAEEFQEHYELGIGMLTYYKRWAEENDNFAVITAEHDFSVPLGFEGIDPRDRRQKPVHYRGRMDCVIQDLESGRYGIIDHKTAVRIDEDYFRKLDKDEQCTSYLWAAEREAKEHGLAYEQTDFIIYNALRKAYPKPPTITSKGLPSLDRQKESTTYEMFMECIEKNNLMVWFQDDLKAQGYADWLKEVGSDNFIIRTPVRRNRAEIESASWRIEAEARDMLNIPTGMHDAEGKPWGSLYPSPSGDRRCVQCTFRAPCIAFDDGSDWHAMIEDGYEKNVDR